MEIHIYNYLSAVAEGPLRYVRICICPPRVVQQRDE